MRQQIDQFYKIKEYGKDHLLTKMAKFAGLDDAVPYMEYTYGIGRLVYLKRPHKVLDKMLSFANAVQMKLQNTMSSSSAEICGAIVGRQSIETSELATNLLFIDAQDVLCALETYAKKENLFFYSAARGDSQPQIDCLVWPKDMNRFEVNIRLDMLRQGEV